MLSSKAFRAEGVHQSEAITILPTASYTLGLGMEPGLSASMTHPSESDHVVDSVLSPPDDGHPGNRLGSSARLADDLVLPHVITITPSVNFWELQNLVINQSVAQNAHTSLDVILAPSVVGGVLSEPPAPGHVFQDQIGVSHIVASNCQ
jgi:hypothetical protein